MQVEYGSEMILMETSKRGNPSLVLNLILSQHLCVPSLLLEQVAGGEGEQEGKG